MKILISGCCGFIGYHLTKALLEQKHEVYGIDNINNYYSTKLKEARLKKIKKEYKNFAFEQLDLSKISSLENVQFDLAINLAAQPGVRLDWKENFRYLDSNITGFHNFLDFCKSKNIKKIIFASSSSVYGDGSNKSFKENQKLSPRSLYAATKLYNENLAEVFSNSFDTDIIGLRFFTVYGSWGRPDMAYYLFTDNIFKGKEITLFNKGKMARDMTHISDIVKGIVSSINLIETNNLGYRIYNLGNNDPIKTIDLLRKIEFKLSKKATINEVSSKTESFYTHANLEKAEKEINYHPSVNLDEGLEEFVSWYISYVSI